MDNIKSFFKFWALAAFAVTALTFTSCNDDEDEEPQPEPEFQTTVDNSLVSADTDEVYNYGGVNYPSVKVAETLQIKYSGSGSPEWTCSDESIALVDQKGLVTGIDIGLVTITATVTEEWSETISSIRVYVVEGDVTVVQDDSLITAETDDMFESYTAVQVEETLQLTYTGSGTPEWKSDDETFATVDQTGLVTGVAVGGPVKITATITENLVMTISTIEIYVREHDITDVVDDSLLSADTSDTADYEGVTYPSVQAGYSVQLIYTGAITPEWAVDNEEIATVTQTGIVVGVAEGLATVTATTLENYVRTISSIKICVTDDKREAKAVTFEEVRAMTAGLIEEDENYIYYIEGYIVSDCDSPNVRSSIPGHTPYTFDVDVNYRTAYIESKDGTYGIRLEFDDSSENTLKRYSEVQVRLAGLTLSRNDDPVYYTLSGMTVANVTVVSENATVPTKYKTISELTDADIFTHVTIQELEIQQKDGTYVNTNDGYSRYDEVANPQAGDSEYSFDVGPLLLYDKNGNWINMLTNVGCPWRRPAAFFMDELIFNQVVPQGSGTLQGVLVSDDIAPIRYGSSNCGRYQIRMLEEDDIQFTDPAFTTTLVEWNWNSGTSETTNVPDIGTGTFSNVSHTYARWRDFNNNCCFRNGNFASQGYGPSCGEHITARWNDIRSGYSPLPASSYIEIVFSTNGISGTQMLFYMTWSGGNGNSSLARAFASNHWQLEYSIDGGSTWIEAHPGDVLDRRLLVHSVNGSGGSSFDTVPGHVDVCRTLPAECFGKSEVRVRVIPIDTVTEKVPDTSSSDWYDWVGHEMGTIETCGDTSATAQSITLGEIGIRYF